MPLNLASDGQGPLNTGVSVLHAPGEFVEDRGHLFPELGAH